MAKPRTGLDDRGYVMVVLLIGMAIAAVWMAATLPAWRQQAVREKEEELIFRGQQYARAIALFYRKNNRTLPSDIDTLVSGRFLRKKWKDPITNDDFALVGQMAQPTPTNGRPGLPGTSGTPGTAGTSGTSGRGATSPTATTPGRGNPTGTSSSVPSPFGGAGSQNGIGGITGVASKSTDTSIKIYQNQQQYNLWQFTLTTSNLNLGGQQGGQNGRPGGPNGQPGGQRPGAAGPGGFNPGGRGPGGAPGAPPPPPPPGGRGRGLS